MIDKRPKEPNALAWCIYGVGITLLCWVVLGFVTGVLMGVITLYIPLRDDVVLVINGLLGLLGLIVGIALSVKMYLTRKQRFDSWLARVNVNSQPDQPINQAH